MTNGYASAELYGDDANGGGVYGSDQHAVVTNCIVSGNTADRSGGGMVGGTANGCTISGNTANESGGGMSYSTANDCTISGNTSDGYGGGGMYLGAAKNCIINGNSANRGGGVASEIDHGLIRVKNCAIFGNKANSGGGIYSGAAQNCTIMENRAVGSGGGVFDSTVDNCIVWYNEAEEGSDIYIPADFLNYYSEYVGVHYSCSPDVPHGVDGNITNAPMLISSSHIAANSPCIGAGSAEYSVGSDIDGEARLNPPSMGCDEMVGSALPPTVQIQCSTPTVAAGYPVHLISNISGPANWFVWDFADGYSETNRVFSEHIWNQPGTYKVVLSAFRESVLDGISATQTIEVVELDSVAVYVAPSGEDSNDGLSWETAKATLQAGVDVQNVIGGPVWVSNGTYVVTNEIVVARPIAIQSVSGPESTVVDGQGVTRCFNLSDAACVISGLTITNGYSESGGGGIHCADFQPMVTNCYIVGNSAPFGGGIYRGTTDHCTISGNVALYSGGGKYDGIATYCLISDNKAGGDGGGLSVVRADHCTITGNTADGFKGGGGMFYGSAETCIIRGNVATNGGGGGVSYYLFTVSPYSAPVQNCIISGNLALNGGSVYDGTVINCTIVENSALREGGGVYSDWGLELMNSIVWYNEAVSTGDDFWGSSYRSTVYSCCRDLIHGVDGNITNAPVFVDAANGDYHLLSNSLCINWGDNAAVIGATDLDGLPRIVGGYVDMGAYEFQGPFTADMDGDDLPDEWERAHFSGNPMPNGNADQDGLSNWDEYIAGTDPTDAASCLAITNCCPGDGFTVEWGPSVTGRLYRVVWSESLTNSTPIMLQDNIEYPQSSFTDTEHNYENSGFYRVEVWMP